MAIHPCAAAFHPRFAAFLPFFKGKKRMEQSISFMKRGVCLRNSDNLCRWRDQLLRRCQTDKPYLEYAIGGRDRMPIQHVWGERFPDKLYKYLRREHGVDLAHHGRLRLQGLASYSDAEEGKRFTEIDSLTYDEYKYGPASSVIRSNLAGIINIADSALGSVISSSTVVASLGNLLTYCTSTMLSKETINSCNPQSGRANANYDACVEIFDVCGFAETLTGLIAAQTSSVPDCIAGKCIYQERTHSIREAPRASKHEIAFIKPPIYEKEREYRLLWTATLGPSEYLYLESPELKRVCRLCEHF